MDPSKIPGIDLSKIPALFPPKGVESNFVNPYSIGSQLIRVGAIFLALMGLCVLIRFYTKIFIQHSWGWEDCESASACTRWVNMLTIGRAMYTCGGEKYSLEVCGLPLITS